MSKHHKSTRADRAAYADYLAECRAADAACWLCQQPIDYTAPLDDFTNPSRFQRDHVQTASAHPELYYDRDNWRPAHAGCNEERSDKEPRPPLGQPSKAWT